MNYFLKNVKNFLIRNHLIPEVFFKRIKKHWIRVICDESTKHLVSDINPELLEVLEISGNLWEKQFQYKSYNNLFYPDFDIQNVDNYIKTYDLIILEHVLEHVTEPCRAIQNVFKLLNPSGYILITTPFLVKIHNAPQDCTRWTPIGLRNLLINEGFDKNNMVTGQWGNKACIKSNFKHWVKYNPLFHSLKNEEMFPAVVWCLARKS
jgi:SAM-dependent methyltransferase